MRFTLTLLVVTVLFLRPAELIGDLQESSLYEGVILTCLLCSALAVVRKFEPGQITHQPVAFCLIAFTGTVVLSHLARLNVGEANLWGRTALKLLVLFSLVAINIDSLGRLRLFLIAIAGLVLIIAVLAMMQYYGAIAIPALAPYQQKEEDAEADTMNIVPRLCGPGIFNDPNDFCVILAIGILISASQIEDQTQSVNRFAWLIPMGIFGWSVILTLSRGGLVALLAGLFVFFRARFGTGKAVAVAVLMLGLLAIQGGATRLTRVNIANQDDTAQSRIQLWSQAILFFRESPLTGIGAGEFEERVGLVVHNSFLHCFTEEGFFGGMFFLGAFASGIATLNRRKPPQSSLNHASPVDPEMERMRLQLLAIAVTVAVGLLSLSRPYSQLPYLVLGVVAAYGEVANHVSPGSVPRLSGRLVFALAGLAIVFLVAVKLFVTVFAR